MTMRPSALLSLNSKLFFFFQAEDGIRDYKVTGVQTCALPISRHRLRDGSDYHLADRTRVRAVVVEILAFPVELVLRRLARLQPEVEQALEELRRAVLLQVRRARKRLHTGVAERHGRAHLNRPL